MFIFLKRFLNPPPRKLFEVFISSNYKLTILTVLSLLTKIRSVIRIMISTTTMGNKRYVNVWLNGKTGTIQEKFSPF
jgi:hypothetical protein